MKRILFLSILIILMLFTTCEAADGDQIFKIDITGADMEYNTPSIGESGTVYLYPDTTDKLYAFYPNGTVKWSITVGAGDWQSNAVVGPGEIIYVLTTANGVKAVYSNSSVKYTTDIGAVFHGGIAVGGDSHVYPVDGGTVYALDENGNELWNTTPAHGGELYTPPVISDTNNMLFISGWLGGMSGMSTIDGTEVWSHDWVENFQYGYIYHTPALSLDESTVYFLSGDGGDIDYTILYAFNALTGVLEWEYDTTDRLYAFQSPTVLSDNAIVFSGTAAWENEAMYCVESDGTLRWRQEFGEEWCGDSNIVELEDGSLIVLHYGDLLSIDQDTGVMTKIFDTTGETNDYASVSVASNGNLYFGTDGTSFYGVEGSTAAMYNYGDYVAGNVPNNFHIWRNQYVYTAILTPTATSTPVIAIPPTIIPTIVPIPEIVPELPEFTIFEEIIILISANWLPILFAYVGALFAKIIVDRENDDLKDILADVTVYGTPGWILILIVNLFINITSISELFSIAVFFSSGFIISLIMNLREIDSKK